MLDRINRGGYINPTYQCSIHFRDTVQVCGDGETLEIEFRLVPIPEDGIRIFS
jgi:hypothetical protein